MKFKGFFMGFVEVLAEMYLLHSKADRLLKL